MAPVQLRNVVHLAAASEKKQTPVVLIPGMWHGTWYFQALQQLLSEQGFDSYILELRPGRLVFAQIICKWSKPHFRVCRWKTWSCWDIVKEESWCRGFFEILFQDFQVIFFMLQSSAQLFQSVHLGLVLPWWIIRPTCSKSTVLWPSTSTSSPGEFGIPRWCNDYFCCQPLNRSHWRGAKHAMCSGCCRLLATVGPPRSIRFGYDRAFPWWLRSLCCCWGQKKTLFIHPGTFSAFDFFGIRVGFLH